MKLAYIALKLEMFTVKVNYTYLRSFCSYRALVGKMVSAQIVKQHYIGFISNKDIWNNMITSGHFKSFNLCCIHVGVVPIATINFELC